MLIGCTTVDIGGPRARKGDPEAGMLEPEGQRAIAVRPDLLNFTGNGSYRWPGGRQQAGHWIDGKLEGIGSETTAKETYTGQWLHGVRHGHGEIQRQDGSRYVGDFADGLPHGKGTESNTEGVYRGTWHQGRRHGQGQFNNTDGSVYQGQWQDNLRDGFGQFTDANGQQYVGEWQSNNPHGFGLMQYANTDTYEGSWVEGARQGYGTFTNAADVIYEGTWQADERHGYGQEKRPDGIVFAGHWQHDQRQGKGVESHPDGSRHSGLWSNDQVSGYGLRITRAGAALTGQWADNALGAGTLSFPDGKSYQGPLFSNQGRWVSPELVSWLESQATGQSHYAQLYLGLALLDFDKPVADPITAAVWLEQASDSGISEAQYRLAMLRISDNASSAISLLNEAAGQSHVLAHEVLGSFYHVGQYVTRDIAQAIKHYQHAADRGSVTAINNLSWLLATTSSEEFADPTKAIEMIRPLVLFLGKWQHLDTLAAAHARLGNTQRAARLERQAILQAQSSASEIEVNEMSQRLSLYEENQAYIE